MINNDLITHIKNLNEQSIAWVNQDPVNRFSSLYSEDISHWNSMNIFTADDFNRHNLICNVFESTRSILGYKPSWAGLSSLSTEALQQELVSLNRIANAQLEDDKAAEAKEQSYLIRNQGFTVEERVCKKIQEKINQLVVG